MIKKLLLGLMFIFVLFATAGCGKVVMMDELNKQGFYPYYDDYLKFNLLLPKEFIYYQTQRTELPNYTDLDFFVPTADTSYPQEVSGYAKPIVVRIFKKTAFDNLSAADKVPLVKVAEKEDKVYCLIFWAAVPSDWKDKWSEAMRQQLINNFSLK